MCLSQFPLKKYSSVLSPLISFPYVPLLVLCFSLHNMTKSLLPLRMVTTALLLPLPKRMSAMQLGHPSPRPTPSSHYCGSVTQNWLQGHSIGLLPFLLSYVLKQTSILNRQVKRSPAQVYPFSFLLKKIRPFPFNWCPPLPFK